MGEQMMFPDTIEEFIDEYKFIDTQKIYTNGSELIQVYRIKQLVDYHNDEVKRLNNIMDELEKFIINNLDHWNKESSQRSSYISEALTKTLDKLKELKGDNNEQR